MSGKNETVSDFLGALQDSLDTQAVCFMEAPPGSSSTVKGKTMKQGESVFSQPCLVFGKRSLPGSPIALWFTKDEKEGKIRMDFKLMVEAQETDTKPYPLTNINVSLRIVDDEGKKTCPTIRSSSSATISPQPVDCSTYFTLSEFSFVKQRIEDSFNTGEPHLFIQWTADFNWVPIEQYTKYMEEKDSSKRKSMVLPYKVSGELPVIIDYTEESVYRGVKGLLNWEQVIIDSGGYNIWFKDTMETNCYYFLPQMFRLKANPLTNAPMMTFSLVRDPNAKSSDPHSYKVRMSFEMVPYYHPRAERDLYREMNKRTNGRVKMCNMMYGGYESATFRMQTDEAINALFHQLGVKPLVEGEIKTTPDSSFTINLESSLDAFNAIKQKIMEGGGMEIGSVIVTVKEGLDNTMKEIALEAELNLMKVAGANIGIKPLESSNKKVRFSHEVELTNNGTYTIEIGGCELSMLSEKKGNERDIVHGLKTDNNWPIILAPREKKVIALQTADVERLNKKNTFLGLNFRKYWTTFICQPYSIHLLKTDLNAIIEDIEDHASSDIKIWEIELEMGFDWSSIPDVQIIEVEIKNEEFAKDEIVKVKKGVESTKVNMSGNLTAIQQAQQIFNRNFQYRLRAVLMDRVTAWSEYQASSGDTLHLFSKAITDLFNNN